MTLSVIPAKAGIHERQAGRFFTAASVHGCRIKSGMTLSYPTE